MPRIEIQIEIKAKKEIVFDLSRSIDLHVKSTEHTKEKAIGGITSGLIDINQTVTWRAKHLGIYQKLTSKITDFEKPMFFAEEMLKGAFKRFRHEHYFTYYDGGTKMIDIFEYELPLGFLGIIADKLFLKKYMTNFLIKRNHTIKNFAESEKWKKILIFR